MTVAPRSHILNGHTEFTTKALSKVAKALAAESSRADHKDISVALADDRGELAVTVTTPLVVGEPVTSLAEQAEDVRVAVVEGLLRLTDRNVSRVDILFSSAVRPERRLR